MYYSKKDTLWLFQADFFIDPHLQTKSCQTKAYHSHKAYSLKTLMEKQFSLSLSHTNHLNWIVSYSSGMHSLLPGNPDYIHHSSGSDSVPWMIAIKQWLAISRTFWVDLMYNTGFFSMSRRDPIVLGLLYSWPLKYKLFILLQ